MIRSIQSGHIVCQKANKLINAVLLLPASNINPLRNSYKTMGGKINDERIEAQVRFTCWQVLDRFENQQKCVGRQSIQSAVVVRQELSL